MQKTGWTTRWSELDQAYPRIRTGMCSNEDHAECMAVGRCIKWDGDTFAGPDDGGVLALCRKLTISIKAHDRIPTFSIGVYRNMRTWKQFGGSGDAPSAAKEAKR